MERGRLRRASHERLMEMVKEPIADGRVREWIQAFLKAGLLDELRPTMTPGKAAPRKEPC